MKSVLQDWVMELPLRHQGTLISAVRGCDLAPKTPLNSIERRLTSAIRGHTLNPADAREMSVVGSFMNLDVPMDLKPSALGHYPSHWFTHVMHAVQIIGCYYPVADVRIKWHTLYVRFCESLHMNPESCAQMDYRLLEDRVKSGTVVS